MVTNSAIRVALVNGQTATAAFLMVRMYLEAKAELNG